jgi:hypothetical protein
MSETAKATDHLRIIKMNTSPVSDILMPDDDDALLDFYQPPVVNDSGVVNSANIKKLVSPYQEDAFSEEVLYEVVNAQLGFVLPYHIWEEINEAFSHFWNVEVGLNGDFLKGAMFISLREYLIADLFYCPDELLQEIVIDIEDFIMTIPGVVIRD